MSLETTILFSRDSSVFLLNWFNKVLSVILTDNTIEHECVSFFITSSDFTTQSLLCEQNSFHYPKYINLNNYYEEIPASAELKKYFKQIIDYLKSRCYTINIGKNKYLVSKDIDKDLIRIEDDLGVTGE